MSYCPLDICSGTGLIAVTDWTGDDMWVCACRAGYEPMPADVAERVALVVQGEVNARRRAQELVHDSYNRRWDFLNGGWQ